MQYCKPPLSFDLQADLLLSRGLLADKNTLVSRLQAVSYYRLSAYLYPFRQSGSDQFISGTTFDVVWKHYTFDRQLRMLVMDAIERVEVALRTQLTCRFAERCGAFGYLDATNLPRLDVARYSHWISELTNETQHSRETFLKYFYNKYGDLHTMPPIWMLAEVMSFGKMLTFFNGVSLDICRDIAKDYGIGDDHLRSWLTALNTIRNICAHHSRLWNRELGVKPIIPRYPKYPQWHDPFSIHNNRIFSILTILKYLLSTIAPTSRWHERFRTLLLLYPDVSQVAMGFPPNWEACAIWSTDCMKQQSRPLTSSELNG